MKEYLYWGNESVDTVGESMREQLAPWSIDALSFSLDCFTKPGIT